MSDVPYRVPGMERIHITSAFLDNGATNDCWVVALNYLFSWKLKRLVVDLTAVLKSKTPTNSILVPDATDPHKKNAAKNYLEVYDSNTDLPLKELNIVYRDVFKLIPYSNSKIPDGSGNNRYGAKDWFEMVKKHGPIIVGTQLSATEAHAMIVFGYLGTGKDDASSQLYLIDTATGSRQEGLLFPHFVERTKAMFDQTIFYNVWVVGKETPAGIV